MRKFFSAAVAALMLATIGSIAMPEGAEARDGRRGCHGKQFKKGHARRNFKNHQRRGNRNHPARWANNNRFNNGNCGPNNRIGWNDPRFNNGWNNNWNNRWNNNWNNGFVNVGNPACDNYNNGFLGRVIGAF